MAKKSAKAAGKPMAKAMAKAKAKAAGKTSAKAAGETSPKAAGKAKARPPSIFERARDKAATMRICQDHGVPCPRSWFPAEQDVATIEAEATEAGLWPLLVKPRVAHGAVGIERVAGPGDLAPILARLHQ